MISLSFKVTGVLVNLFFGVIGLVYVQNAVFAADDWRETLGEMTQETNSLLKENQRLNQEHESLQAKAARLKAELQKSRLEVARLESEKRKRGRGSHLSEGVSAQTKAELAQMQKDIDALESENVQLQRQLDDIKEKNRLWRLKSAQLTNQKRDVNLDLNYLKSTSGQEGELAELQAKLAASLKEEQQLRSALASPGTLHDMSAKEKVALRKENTELEKQLKRLKEQISAQERANERNQRKTGKSDLSRSSVSPELLSKKKQLESEVARLAAQLDGFSTDVAQSKEELKKRRAMMDRIMKLDAENQALRAKIDQMQVENQK